MSAERIGRMTIFLLTTLSVFAILVSTMPIPVPAEYTQIYHNVIQNIPFNNVYYGEYMLGGNLTANDSHNLVAGSSAGFTIPPASANPEVATVEWVRGTYWGSYLDQIELTHVNLNLFHNRGSPVITEELVAQSITVNNENLSYIIVTTTEPFTFHVLITFNTHLYSNLTVAWEAGYLNMTVGFPLTSDIQSVNVWTIIGQIMFFQAPYIDPVINSIIAVPLWTLFAYLMYRFLRGVIPFLGGF